MTRMDLTDEESALIEPFLPPERPKKQGRPWASHRAVLNGIFWSLRTGAPWRDVPESDAFWGTVYGRFRRWMKEGLWQRLLDTLQGEARRMELGVERVKAA
jgi:transposase